MRINNKVGNGSEAEAVGRALECLCYVKVSGSESDLDDTNVTYHLVRNIVS